MRVLMWVISSKKYQISFFKDYAIIINKFFASRVTSLVAGGQRLSSDCFCYCTTWQHASVRQRAPRSSATIDGRTRGRTAGVKSTSEIFIRYRYKADEWLQTADLAVSLQRGQLDPKFQVEGVTPPPPIILHG